MSSISCQSVGENPGFTLIPYMLEYTVVEDYSRFVRFCATQTYAEGIDLSSIDYKLYNYLDNSISSPSKDSPCLTTSCATATAPFLGFGNIVPNPIASRTKIEDKNKATTYILAAVAGVLGLILIGIIIAYAMKVRKDKLLGKIKTTKDVTYNPVYSPVNSK